LEKEVEEEGRERYKRRVKIIIAESSNLKGDSLLKK
jgi:hypothetical protein